MIFKDVELNWVSLDKDKPGKSFNGDPEWSLEMRTSDKKQANEWKTEGLNVKPKEIDGNLVYVVKVKKPAVDKSGKPAQMPAVVGKDLLPVDGSKVGNGSRGNVKVFRFEYDYNGRQGIGFRLQAVQVTDLKEFEGSRNSVLEGFESLEGDSFTPEVDSDEVY